MNVNKSIFQYQTAGRYLALLVHKFTVSYNLAFLNTSAANLGKYMGYGQGDQAREGTSASI